MREQLKTAVFASLLAVSPLAFAATAPAHAAGEVAQVELCAAALDAQGLAAASDYRAKFIKSKGGAIKTVTIELIPMTSGGEVKTAECQIKRGEVTDVAVSA